MGLRDFLGSLFGANNDRSGLPLAELARRLGTSESVLRQIRPEYTIYEIPKRQGGVRQIAAPAPHLKDVQRRILRRVLARLRVHPAVHGFERSRSIVSNAREHAGRAVVIRMDLKDFFPSTAARRVDEYFRAIGWSPAAAAHASDHAPRRPCRKAPRRARSSRTS